MADRTNREHDYVYADLGRAGLGNLLFPWSRSVLAAHQLNIPMLPPKWFKIRIGPLVRGDVDRRRYHCLFAPPSFREAARRELLVRRATLWSESGRLLRRGTTTNILVTAGLQPYFQPLLAWRGLILRRLLLSLHPRSLGWMVTPEPYVAFHIRLGDFIRPNKGAGRPSVRLPAPTPRRPDVASEAGAWNRSTPLSWFLAAEKQIRAEGWDYRIVICSDGTDKELRPLRDLPFTTIKRGGNAIEDLLTLANATIVVGSGSSFSAWGAFLAEAPLFVAAGLNHFLPKEFPVREVTDWGNPELRALLRADLDASPPEPQMPPGGQTSG